MILHIKNIRFTNQSPADIFDSVIWHIAQVTGIELYEAAMSSAVSPFGVLTGTLILSGRALSRSLAAVLRAIKNRRDAAILASLDQRMLSDIGLTQADVRDAFAEPFWRDPTAIMAHRAVERRRGPRLGFQTRRDESPSMIPDLPAADLALQLRSKGRFAPPSA